MSFIKELKIISIFAKCASVILSLCVQTHIRLSGCALRACHCVLWWLHRIQLWYNLSFVYRLILLLTIDYSHRRIPHNGEFNLTLACLCSKSHFKRLCWRHQIIFFLRASVPVPLSAHNATKLKLLSTIYCWIDFYIYWWESHTSGPMVPIPFSIIIVHRDKRLHDMVNCRLSTCNGCFQCKFLNYLCKTQCQSNAISNA